ncbi:GmrSD restriction endonuclease domain-containing protein [Campylobacter coli]
MVQNYLRVARSGMSNNHHHWLTPFLKIILKFINNDKLEISYERVNNEDKPEELQIKIGDYNITTNFQNFLNTLNPGEELIEFLENLDTALAKEQASAEEIKKDLLGISNDILDQLKIKNDQIDAENIFFIEDENGISVLDQGTATPHYWFYRLEYYLWKYSKIKYYLDGKNLKEIKLKDKNFGDIANNFYFRNLNSIEHVQAQSKANEKDWDDENIDNFGNLALISSSFNSSLSNLDTQDKYLYINKDNNIISLKLWLIYALSEKNQLNWTFNKAQEHRRQMLEILKKSFNNGHDKA